MVNKHLVKDMQKLGLWNQQFKNEIIRAGGSVQGLAAIPDNLKAVYRTVWEISQKAIIDNIFMENPSLAKLSSMHLYGWKKGLKTGMYYLRTRSKAKAQQVTVPLQAAEVCRRDNPESCHLDNFVDKYK